ncbi:SUMF1/EgtB/PvdO family nonheme iron enzyme [Candidatus Synechococcus calcipolaris G9]|uniref:SUMF1/EgtB/PvdO family nonheme iron enzyme n=1 Tax=Candidatus Synechococcus calcipolaris G9 TaxID=1497997 RepID=A0ABT6EVX6_9SYNE|nr:SUMF1/EgtB/PvdO family nonheme iron enzyme [Candidatus Synechococcus calcipolaris]MDG2989937.1 SUMF1/EgtB/PvdO family nonheme iron enzyme [Candidatus Synechococcus calcipolaris G9]
MNHNSTTSRATSFNIHKTSDHLNATHGDRLRIDLKTALEESRAATLDLVAPLSETILCHQAHPNFSPVGWHWGHIGFTEGLWLLEKMLGQPPLFPHYRSLFAADGLPKHRRRALPPAPDIRLYVDTIRQQVLEALEQLDPMALSQQARLWWWILHHEAQHAETIQMVLALQQALPPLEYIPRTHSCQGNSIHIPQGNYEQGSHDPFALDNEQPRHLVPLSDFSIDQHPVSQGDYQAFIDAGGYETAHWWSTQGWQWLQAAGVTQPCYQLSAHPEFPVCGLSGYEAEAYACFRGQRLPTETEWEIAAQSGQLQGTGQVWEWTATWFAPYPGFQSFPYPGYSETYFDQQHRVLRGGSWASRNLVKRPSFRNWYPPETREVFAGLRLCHS